MEVVNVANQTLQKSMALCCSIAAACATSDAVQLCDFDQDFGDADDGVVYFVEKDAQAFHEMGHAYESFPILGEIFLDSVECLLY